MIFIKQKKQQLPDKEWELLLLKYRPVAGH